ncbi:hypothetical protein B0J17DRAFT_455942 [Rhizoctonia solani]|nr:hypothetical protein B0J17DRAFT_455942 [Rhizoctonia solani]
MTTVTTNATTMANRVFSSVELVLMLLSMYACVTRDIRTTVMFLLEIVFGYEPLTRKFGRKPSVHEVRTLFEPLSALALFHSTEYTLEDIQTEADALVMVSAILRPILIRLSPAEFAEIHNKADDAVDIMIYTPLSELQQLVAQWASDARSNTKLDNWLEWSRTYLQAGETDIKPVDVPKAGAIVAQYLYGESAAASASCSLRRAGRVEKRQREDAQSLDLPPAKRRAVKDPLPVRPCPVHVMVISPTSESLASLAMDVQPFIRSHRGVGRGPGEWIECGALDAFKYPVKSADVAAEPALTLESSSTLESGSTLDLSDNHSTTDESDIISNDEEHPTIPISRTLPDLHSTKDLGLGLVRSQSAPQLTYASRTRSPSELATHGTLATLSSISPSRIASPHWRAFSISSRLSEATNSDISDWSLRMQWLEHEDDSFVMSRGGSTANLRDISYESFVFPRAGRSDGSHTPWAPSWTPSDATITTPTSSTAASSTERLFDGWAQDWQSEQVSDWTLAVCQRDESEPYADGRVAQYIGWAEDWDSSQLEGWSNSLSSWEVEVCLDAKGRRVEIRQPVDNALVRISNKIRSVFRF